MRRVAAGRTLWAVVPGQLHVAIESDADLAALARLELVAVELDGVGVREDNTVANTDDF